MDSKISFIRYLATEHSLDYWSDVGIEHAIELANALLASDWAELHEGWTSLEAIVQVRIGRVEEERQ